MLRFDPAATGIDGGARATYLFDLAPREAQTVTLTIGCDSVDSGPGSWLLRPSPKGGAAGASLRCFPGHRHHHLERDLQRGSAPLGLRSLHADHRKRRRGPTRMRASRGSARRSAATGSSQRCRRCGSTRPSRAACSAISPPLRHRASIPQRTPSRARSCTRSRNGEMAALGEVPFRRYYGSVDARRCS